jgi:predicted ATPase/class 3 adenylate cyclase/Tfp pilus assembly protein PilF
MPIFLFTDIEGSTQKWERFPEQMKKVLLQHDSIMKTTIEQFGGCIIKHTGDGVFAVFEDGDPLMCAVEIQKAIAGAHYSEVGGLRVRIGMHAGHPERRGSDYFGPVINRTARVMAAAWGGQIILTPAAAQTGTIPDKATLKDLGTHLLKDLCDPQPLFQLVHPELALREFPSLQSLSSHPQNLPVQSTPFLGRERELTETTKLLRDPSCRLLTLIGPGGIGKTRLALQAAAERIEDFMHGVFFIPLAPLISVDFLISTIADALKFSFYSKEDEKIQLLNYLREKEMLLIMDNFEHLMQGVSVIADILNAAPRVKILVASRELLNLKGEWVLQVEGMDVPSGEQIDIEGYSAVQLFFHSARRVDSKIMFSPQDKKDVIHICQLVGGLPLGIELASVWLRTLSLTEIAKEIEKSIDFLETSLRDVPHRHRSLRAVFEYSWDLLSESERDILMKLSVFSGEFDRAAAEGITGTNLSMLAGLVEKSLLRKTAGGRYELLDILRRYTLQKLEESPDSKARVYDLHCSYFLKYVEDNEDALLGADQKNAAERFSENIENVRTAWRWAVDRDLDKELNRAINGLYIFYTRRGWYHEGEDIFRETVTALERKEMKDVVYVKALKAYGTFMSLIGKTEHARDILQKGLSTARDLNEESETAYILNVLGGVVGTLGEYGGAMMLHEESLAIFRKRNDRAGMARALYYLASAVDSLGDYEKAKEFSQESLRVRRETGDSWGEAACLNLLGNIAHTLGDFDDAKRYYEESYVLSKKLGDRAGMARIFNNLGNVYSQSGEHEMALKNYEESLKIFRELGNARGVASALANYGTVARKKGDYETARRAHQEGLQYCREIGYQVGIAVLYSNLAADFRVTGDIDKAYELERKSLEIGKQIGDKWVTGMSLENLADLSFAKGDYTESKTYCREGLKIAVKYKIAPIMLADFVAIARLWIREEKKEEALRLLYIAREHPAVTAETKIDADKYVNELKAVLPPANFTAVLEKARKETAENVADEIADTLT